ncbi:hypothetical protein GCK72_025930 [Caenorhabditis remanei]|uniref:RING-type domain-containing protein n=1 Tax=Caenorhabditis remanei TaxID=31234 RepID=A0A6A5G446_CAERE|nr:hypothetical protein GCK72_025930 [Caenorhabditis remanei]KAF1749462.1 hypothetical protein GCK72_025930 [Caenorhabditis remanei]
MELELNHYKKYICNMAVEKQDDGLLKSQLLKCQVDYAQLLKEKKSCEINLESQQSEIQKLKYAFEQSQQQQIQLGKNIQSMRNDYGSLKSCLKETEQKLEAEQGEVNKLTEYLEISRSQLQVKNSELSNIIHTANNVDYYETEIQRLKGNLGNARQIQALLLNNNEDLTKKNEELNTNLMNITDQLNENKHVARKNEEEYSMKLEEIFKNFRTERNQLWDDMMFYKNKVDFPASSPNWESHITKLESQLKESSERNQKLQQENSHLQCINDPDDCSICYEQLPLSRCLTENCKKNYHNKCIIRHFQGKGEEDQKCPYCNKRSVKIGIDCLGREKD